MNISQVRQLKDGDEVEYGGHLPAFTVRKHYKVKVDMIGGVWLYDDNGLGWPLVNNLPMEMYFEKVEVD